MSANADYDALKPVWGSINRVIKCVMFQDNEYDLFLSTKSALISLLKQTRDTVLTPPSP